MAITASTHFTNPIIPGFAPDPSVCRVGRDYYLVTSSFEYYPGIPLYHSRDLVSWRLLGHCLTRPSQLQLSGARASGGIFAPTIRFYEGTFYVTSTNVSAGGHFVVRADDPRGPWSDPVWIDQDGIDPSLYFEGGDVFLSSTVEPTPSAVHEANPSTFIRGIQQSLIDIDTGRRLGEPRLIWTGTGGQYPEAPHLYRVDDRYYLLIAEGGTGLGHMVTIARSESPWGPFESCPRNPILTHRSTSSPIQATGHGDMVQAHDGSWWIFCLGTRPLGFPPRHHLGRETFLAPVHWLDDGWPAVGERGMVDVVSANPGIPRHPWPNEPVRDEFTDPDLRPIWSFARNPEDADWSLRARPGWLQLMGNASTLSHGGAIAFVGRRQQHFLCTIRALLDFEPKRDGEEAGLVARMNERHHYEIGVARVAGQRCVLVRRRVGDIEGVETVAVPENGRLVLQVAADELRYSFSWSTPGGAPVEVASAETRYLSSEVAGGFTGVFLGMYATGSGHRSLTPASWDWFEYDPLSS